MTRLRTAIGRLVLIALVITASPGLGGTLYESCPAGCCTPHATQTGCAGAEGGTAKGRLELLVRGRKIQAVEKAAYIQEVDTDNTDRGPGRQGPDLSDNA